MALTEPEAARMKAFLGGDPLESPEHAIELLCMLQDEVSYSWVTDDVPSDCFCGNVRFGAWRNNGDSLRWIINTVMARLRTVEALREEARS